MKSIDLMNACYQVRNSNARESDKIEQLRKIAKDIVSKDKNPVVVYHWSENPCIKMNIVPFSDANETMRYLNMVANSEGCLGYFKTKLDIYFMHNNELCSYECLRYDIGCDGEDLISHIQSYRNNAQWLSDDDKGFLDGAISALSKAV